MEMESNLFHRDLTHTHMQVLRHVSVSQFIFSSPQPPSSFLLIITAMRKAEGGGRQGDSI